MTQQNVTLKAAGLYTYPNLLGAVPDGALTAASNVVIDREGVASNRRGFAVYGTSMGGVQETVAKQLMTYKGRILRHWLTTVDFDNNGAGSFAAISSNITEQSIGGRLKYLEANGNLYFTSNAGIQKVSAVTAQDITNDIASAQVLTGNTHTTTTINGISSTSTLAFGMLVQGSGIAQGTTIVGIPNSTSITISQATTTTVTALSITFIFPIVTPAGGIEALDGIGTLNNSPGWFIPNSEVAYRIVWGITDANGNLVLGDPSDRIVVDNQLLSSTVSDYNQLIADLNVVATVSPITTTGNTHTNTIIDNIPSTTNLSVGMLVSGSGIQTNTTISSITSSTAITISLPATSTVVGDALTFRQVLNDPNFLDLLIPSNSSSLAVYNALNTLAQTLDTDLGEHVYFGLSGTITQILPTVSITTTGNSTVSSATITNIPSTVNISPGMIINGSGIPLNSLVVSVPTATSITINNTIAVAQTGFTFNCMFNTEVTSPNHGLATGALITIAGTNCSPSIDTTTPIQITVINANTFTVPTVTSTGGNTGTWTQYPAAIAQGFTTPPSDPATAAQLLLLQNYYNAIVNALNVDPGISTYALSFIGGAFSNSSQSATVTLTFPIPDGVTGAYFYQVYRSDMALAQNQTLFSEITADDEMREIAEDNPTLAQLTAKTITFFDDIPESFRLTGANLYTNAISGEGILQENNIPPLAQDMALYQGSTFYANTVQKQSLLINLLSATNLLGQTLTVTSNGIAQIFTFVSEAQQIVSITTPVGSAFASTGTADSFTLFSANNLASYQFWFNVGTVTPPVASTAQLVEVTIASTDTADQVAGKLFSAIVGIGDFETVITGSTLTVQNTNVGFANAPVDSVTAAGFAISVSVSGTGNNPATKSIGVSTAATPAQEIAATSENILYVINAQFNSAIQAFYLSGPSDLPGQMNFEAIHMGAPYFYLTSSIGSAFSPVLPATGTSVSSNNTPAPNRLYFSKYQQPESVPLTNFQDVGPKDKAILRILPLRDCLFILKEDGIYQLTGNQISNFTVYPFDTSTKLKATDSAVVLNNQVYMYSDQGVVTVSSTGVSVISRPIENLLLPVISYNDYTTATFGVSYETDRAYLLWTLAKPSDTTATVCYRYNTFTTTWVSWPIDKTSGVVVPETNILYLGPSDINSIEQERKSYTRIDQADRQYTLNVPRNAINGIKLSLGGLFESATGDSLVQTQYLTINQFNRLCNMLDLDPGVTNAYSTILAIPGANIRDSLTALAALLDTEPHPPWTEAYSSAISGFGSDFVSCQEAFNVIVTLLNDDSGTKFKNYAPSSGTVILESTIASTNVMSNTITLTYALNFIQGPIILYKAIDSLVEWAPHTFGDTSMLKKVSEATLIFDTMDFTQGVVSYASDLSPGLVPVPFPAEGSGVWNQFQWGGCTWGGNGSSRPLRTYIPFNKQRCRFIVSEFEHNVARETYAIFGISLTWEPVSSRAYR
jgi:hypothetical protein